MLTNTQGWQAGPVSHNSAGAHRGVLSQELLAKGRRPSQETTAGTPFEMLFSTEVRGRILCLRSVHNAVD